MGRWIIFALVLSGMELFGEVMTFTKEVPVYRSEESSRYVSNRVPVEECWDEEVPVEDSGSEMVGAIIGGTAGGILGHQVGGGSGKTAATVGGAIIGTLIGKSLAEREARPGYKIVRRCRTRYRDEQRRIVEYRNYARVLGREIVKYSDRPLRSIPVKITIEY
ncbi:MAG: glycine zipper 2TM domain-containing protein [Epsilonproteobacteria bacterium]|nr:hypothetical protein [Campylobacterota bacterium]NPA57411.1 glycine zipper 2TM domain-containing protein [Campylobacterota bacterium]